MPIRPNAALQAALLSVLLPLVPGACRGPNPEPLPPGPGLVSFDRDPPAGAETWEAPDWRVGDRFVYEKGGIARLALRVESEAEGVLRLVDEESGLVTLIGEDLRELGQEAPAEPGLARSFDPADHPASWPLWVGKRWVCQYVSRAPGRPDLPLVVSYRCDGVDELRVAAGSYRALRIWRRARVALQGNFVERVSLLWYAPEVGTFVRRLDDGLLVELVEVQRQDGP